MTPAAPPVVVVVNSSPDTLEMIQQALHAAGIIAVTALADSFDGPSAFAAFLRQHNASAILYDISPPYQANWQWFAQLRSAAPPTLPLVLTSTDANRVMALVGQGVPVYQVFGKPYELDDIVDAVKKATNVGRAE